MPSDIDRPQLQNANILNHYDTTDGFLIVMIGVTTTYRWEEDGVTALRAVADREDRYLIPCVKVRTKGRR